MPLPTGLGAQLMVAEESTWGTAATPARGLPLVSETIKQQIDRLESQGIIAGAQLLRSQQWSAGNISIAGDLQLELYNLSIGLLLKHLFGTVVTAGAGPYTHTFTPDLTGIAGKGLTLQKGVPNIDGSALDPFNLIGCKIANGEITVAAGGITGFKLGIIGKSESTSSPALQSISYASGITPFTFLHLGVTIAAGAVPVKSLTLSFDNGYDTRMFAGSQSTSEPVPTKLRTFGISLVPEKSGLTAYNRYVNGTEAAIVATFTRAPQILQFTYNARFDGDTPNVGGTGVIDQPLTAKAVGATTDAGACTCVFTTSEATP